MRGGKGPARATELLLLAVVAVLFATALPAPVSAASVTVPITVTIAESGAPGFTWLVSGASGCTPSPTSGTTGSTVDVVVNSGCSITISVPADGSTQRDRLVSSTGVYVTSLVEGPTNCGSGTCNTIAIAAHVQELLTMGAGCYTPVVSVVSPTGDRWFIYGTMLTVSCSGIWGRSGGTGTRAASWNWDGGTNANIATTSTFASSLQTMNEGHAFNVNTVTQYQLALDSGATGAFNSITAPSIPGDYFWYDTGTLVTYVGNGVYARANGLGDRSSSWYLDSNPPSSLLTSGTFSVPVALSSSHTLHVTTKAQLQVTLNSAAALVISSITTPTIPGDNYWYDAGTAVSVVLNGVGSRSGGTGIRLTAYSINGGTPVSVATSGKVTILNALSIGQNEFIVASSVTQYQLSVDAVSGVALSAVTPPPIQGDNYWYDSGTQLTYTGEGVYGRASGTGYRVTEWSWDSGPITMVQTTGAFPAMITMNSPHTLHSQSVVQFQVAITGTYGVSSATSPTISGDNYWYDSGTTVSLSLQGVFARESGVGERTTAYSVNGGSSVPVATAGSARVLDGVVLNYPVTISVQAVKQFELTLDATTAKALDSITPATLAGDDYWYDSGTVVSIVLNGVWNRSSTTGMRLTSYSVDGGLPSTVATSGTVTILGLSYTGPQVVDSSATTQYLLQVSGGGGASYSVPPPINGDTGWYDSGTTLKVSTNGTYNSTGSTRERVSSWSLDTGGLNQVGLTSIVTTSAMVIDSPHSVRFDSVTQYLVTFVVKGYESEPPLHPSTLLVNTSGGTQSVTGASAWFDAGSSLSVSTVVWSGVDVPQLQPASYTVASPFTLTTTVGVYNATLFVKDPLGFPVGGAAATITLANGTVLRGTSAGDGTVRLNAIPLGTYWGSVSFLGFTSDFAGNAANQESLQVAVPLSYWVIGTLVLLVLIAIATLIAVFRLHNRRRPYGWQLPPYSSHLARTRADPW